MPDGHTERGGVKSDETLLSIVEHLGEVDGTGVTELADRLGAARNDIELNLVYS